MLPNGIKEAALFIKRGGLVAFPTETVYGLGGDALNKKTVEKIYTAKGRPGDNPLIVHVAEAEDFWRLTHGAPEYAKPLIEAFWPGPLTLVANKDPGLPKWVGVHPSNEASTIAVRMPSHPTAVSLLEESGCFIAAPSANKSGRPSPTSVHHVAEDFPECQGHDIFILDGGHSTVGLESTVVDVTGDRPVILRPGSVTQEDIELVTKLQVVGGIVSGGNAPRSPGTKYKHYSPKAPLTILVGNSANIADYITDEAKTPSIIGALVMPATFELLDESPKIIISGPQVELFAQNLYANLRAFDNLGVDRIFAECTPLDGIGFAVMDRMQKAAEGRLIIV